MKRKVSKKAQVFLILAIVVLIYILLLSATVYKLTESPYINPAPDQERIMNYIDNAITNIYGLGYISLSRYSQGESKDAITQTVEDGIDTISNYLTQANIPNEISLVSTIIITNSSSQANPVYTYVKFNVSISIDTPTVYYSSVIEVHIEFEAAYSNNLAGTENYIIISKSIQSSVEPVSDAVITVSPTTTVTNMGNGEYKLDLQAGQTITIVLSHEIYLWIEL